MPFVQKGVELLDAREQAGQGIVNGQLQDLVAGADNIGESLVVANLVDALQLEEALLEAVDEVQKLADLDKVRVSVKVVVCAFNTRPERLELLVKDHERRGEKHAVQRGI